MHIKADDVVEVIAGASRGKRARVLKVMRAEGKLIVEGVNQVYRHVRKSQRNMQGGRLSKEMPIQLSNVLLVCSSCSKASRTGARLREDGTKERYCKKCKTGIGVLSPSRSKKAAAKR